MRPILFKIIGPNPSGGPKRKGTPAILFGRTPLPASYLKVNGYTKNRVGAIIPTCTVRLFRTRDNCLIGTTESDAGGFYEFRQLAPAETYYIVAYKTGFPDTAGTTVNTLVGS